MDDYPGDENRHWQQSLARLHVKRLDCTTVNNQRATREQSRVIGREWKILGEEVAIGR